MTTTRKTEPKAKVVKKAEAKKDNGNGSETKKAERVSSPETPQDDKGESMEVQDRNGQAVVSVPVPAHTREVVVAESLIPGCAAAAVQAWNAVKGKGDADFASAQGPFRRELINLAEDVFRRGINSGRVGTADEHLPLHQFELEVLRIKQEQDAAKGE